MNANVFASYEFFTGVPDSLLKPLSDWIYDTHGVDPRKHIVAANEGNAVAIATGYYMATGKVPVVYLQNSGIGNITNPVASLVHEKVYNIPILFIVGWRGDPGVTDEPQHVFQGEVTLEQLKALDITIELITTKTKEDEFAIMHKNFKSLFSQGKCAAFVISKGSLKHEQKTIIHDENNSILTREDAIRIITSVTENDAIISTTGKASRELYEIRQQNNQPHHTDFLTVGSMGHSSSIALGIALHKPDKKVWIIDGDGAALMHTGAMALIGANAPANLVHIVINNAAHESVGGTPTIADKICLTTVAEGFNYPITIKVTNANELKKSLEAAKNANHLVFIEVITNLISRDDLGRPKESPIINKQQFMQYLSN